LRLRAPADLCPPADHPRALLRLLPAPRADRRELRSCRRLLLGVRQLAVERLRVDLAARPLRARPQLRRLLRQRLLASRPGRDPPGATAAVILPGVTAAGFLAYA